MKVLLVFIDGFGLGKNDEKINPFVSANIPNLKKILKGNFLTKSLDKFFGKDVCVIPTDSTLGLDGIPQSATNQTALLTGVNAPKIIGQHLSGYPTDSLIKILKENSVFKKIKELGLKGTFANAFRNEYFKWIEEGKRVHSATTWSALSADLKLRGIDDLIKGEAVYMDIINEILIQTGYNNLEKISPSLAGKRLIKISENYNFTLFEYFLTDAIGHSQNMETAKKTLEIIDEFIGSIYENISKNEILVIITSDHGNIEDLSVNTHTRNLVPTFVFGKNAEKIASPLHSILDITPLIIELQKN